MSLDLVKQISKSTLKKYKKRTFENNNTKSLALLKNEPEKYIKVKELIDLSKTKKHMKLPFNKTKKNKNKNIDKGKDEINQRMKYLNQSNLIYEKKIKKPLVETLVKEFKSRVKESTKSYASGFNKYRYFKETKKGNNYIQFNAICGCDVITILDFEKLSKGHEFFSVGDIVVSDDEQYVAFSIDFTGDRLHKLYYKPLFGDKITEIKVKDNFKPLVIHDILAPGMFPVITSGNCQWNKDSTGLYYITYDKSYRPYKLWYYNLKNDTHKCVFTEKNQEQFLYISGVESGDHLLLYSESYSENEVYVVCNDSVTNIFKRKNNVMYSVCHLHSTWFILKADKDNYKAYSSNDLRKLTFLFGNIRKHIFDKDSLFLKGNYLCLTYKESATNMMIYNICTKELKTFDLCEIGGGCTYSISAGANLDVKTNYLVFVVHSFLMPAKTIKLNLSTLSYEVIFEFKPKNYKFQNYEEKRIIVNSNVEMTVMYHKKKFDKKKLRPNKCVLYGYGSYGATIEPEFDVFIPSLLDRGFVYCIGHIRGGGIKGHKGYEGGKLLNKINTFKDFIECAKYLIRNKYTSQEKLAIWGRSAGGLLIGSTINMEPSLFNLAILGVPFLDPIGVLSNPENPLAIESYREWGNPNEKKVHDYMKRYSPQDNIDYKKKYPNIFIYSNLNDTLVPYLEPFNYYLKMKGADVFTSGERDIIMNMKLKYGHSQSSKRYEYLYEYAEYYAIILNYIY